MSDPPPTKQDVERARELEAQLLPMMTRHDRIPAIAQALTAEYERGRREERERWQRAMKEAFGGNALQLTMTGRVARQKLVACMGAPTDED